MPSYFFHLAFELYHGQQDDTARTYTDFIPPANLNLWSVELPVHRVSTWTQLASPLKTHHPPPNIRNSFPEVSHSQSTKTSASLASHSIAAKSNTSPTQSKHKNKEASPKRPHGSKAFVDWRFGKVSIQSVDMESATSTVPHKDYETSTSPNNSATAMKGRYVPTNPKTTEIGWGVVHLYRDLQETADLGIDTPSGLEPRQDYAAEVDEEDALVDKDCTTLCILAVPSYMTPSDLLGWTGERAGEDISHFRLVKTARSNKYMALMKFRDAKVAKHWQKEWNGRLFSSMEPEYCHVVFIKSIQFQSKEGNRDPSSFPDMSNDPFAPALRNKQIVTNLAESHRPATSLTTKPAPPPTPSLVELPTCPVCLERMDETTGLLTIFCQHVFHCACLQKWRGSGCPVCRYTQDEVSSSKKTDSRASDSECKACGSAYNLWACVICGHVGCGRYDDAHAFAHYEQTGHAFAMDIATQHVWDYVGDGYVHRLLQNTSDGKLVELRPTHSSTVNGPGDEMLPREKVENISLEYTYLLTNQLESQRIYFEEQLERAVDKASHASSSSERATASADKMQQQFEMLQTSYDTMLHDTLPQLERDSARQGRRAERFENTARSMTKQWQEEKAISESLMDRVHHLEKHLNEATLKNSELEEQNRDLSFFISGMEKLKDQTDDVVQGTVSVADAPAPGKKGKKKR